MRVGGRGEWGNGDTVVVLPYPGRVGVDQVTHVHTISLNFSVYLTPLYNIRVHNLTVRLLADHLMVITGANLQFM